MRKKINNEALRRTQQPILKVSPALDPIQRADKLLGVCIELLELCIEVTGTIDPAGLLAVSSG